MDDSTKQSTRRRRPNPKWLPVVALVLALWAAALGTWWSRLQRPIVVARAQTEPTARPTVTSRPTLQPGETVSPTPMGTPVAVPVVRDPGHIVEQEDWLALAQAFDVESALSHIAELTKPEYAGRAVGSPGSWLAGDWIAARFEEYGLQPAGDNGTYFQEFPVPYTDLTAMPTLELINDAGQQLKAYRFRHDYTIWPGDTYTDGGYAEGQVFWVSDGEHDDYDDIDVQGGVVLCRYQRPFDEMQRQALEHGAEALLMIQPEGIDLRMRRTARSDALLPEGIPTLIVSEAVVGDLLAASGLTIQDLSIQYKSVPLGTRLRIEVPLEYRQGVRGRNVLGVIPGTDEDGIQQVFIIGGHYDHMGADPDGTFWPGANDDVSGVAVLLEIARQWQEHGYVPKRTVLFAAWDGEEIGLNGARYYVEHPRYPLDDTVGMLQLDMVGAGTPTLSIDEGGLVANQSILSAEQLGISVLTESSGGSDHAPFKAAGVPATLYIWWTERSPGLVYHVPEDDINNIEPERLQAAGELAQLTAMQFSWEHEELEDLIAAFQQAIAARDEASLAAMFNYADQEQQTWQERWLADLALHPTSEFTATVGQPLVSGNVATSTVSLRYRWAADDPLVSASFMAQWVRPGLEWYYRGLTWEELQGENVVVQHVDLPLLASDLVEEADELYDFLTREVGLTLPDTVRIQFYGQRGSTDDVAISQLGSRHLLHALNPPPAGYEQATGWPVADGIVLSDNADLSTALTEFALNHSGWPSSTANWLAQGLMDTRKSGVADADEDIKSEYLARLLEAARDDGLWAAQELPSRWQVHATERDTWEAQAWAMTDYLLQRRGWEGLRDPTTVVTEVWRTAELDSWLLAAQGIEETLQKRAQAVLARDSAAFMSTVDRQNEVLYVEEMHWFEDLEEYPAQEFSYESQLLELDDDHAIVDLQVHYRVPNVEWRFLPVSYRAQFVHRDGTWYYTDLDFYEERSDHFVLKYEHEDYGGHAAMLLADAERAYEQITLDLDAYPRTPIEIKLYHQSDVFRFSIYMSMHRITGWNEPGEAIKLNVSGQEEFLEQGAGRVIAHELTHAALFAIGVQHGAVHEGICEYQAIRFDPVSGSAKLRDYRTQVYDLVRSKRAITIEDLTNWREVPSDDLQLFYSVGYDFVTYFRERFGREVLLVWLQQLASGASFREAFAEATGMPFSDFDTQWREAVLRGHIDLEYIETALDFSAERAYQDVEALAQPGWAGREAGTPGNEAAAHYIADQFAAYGLEPAAGDASYLQNFDVSRTALAALPSLGIAHEDGRVLEWKYGVEFHEVLGEYAGDGSVSHAIAFIADPQSEGVNLGGRVMLTRGSGDPWRDAQEAVQRGAGGLLLITEKWEKHMKVKTSDVRPLSDQTIPVLELTREAATALFGLAGYRAYELDNLPPILVLPLSARMAVQVEFTAAVEAANILGVLPGSDPELANEVLILGAHLDGVGSLPDGTVFPGANNDASGVAVLLEIARLWHESGYRPRRTILFAAWNAAELGLEGSRYYVAHPAYPLQDTIGVIQLDQVGQGGGFYIIVSANEQQESLLLAYLDNAAGQVEGRLTFERYSGGSDHDPFHLRGVPALLLAWEDPRNEYLPDDTPETIDTQKLRATGRVTALTLMTLADR